jgi:membrane-associated phospholipid phosphatase
MAAPNVIESDRASTLAGVTDPVLWVATALLALGVGVSVLLLRWRIEHRSIFMSMQAVALLGAVGAFYHLSGRSAALARFTFAMALSIALAYTCQLTTFVLGVTGMPFQSALLTSADAMLGFSWPVWKSWVVSHPGVEIAFQIVYPRHFAATGLTVAALALLTPYGAMRFLRAFAIAFAVSAIAQLIVPAMTNAPDAPSNALRLALRDGTFDSLDARVTLGLISMPSMHAALAVLVWLAMWRYKVLRIPLSLFSVIMLFGTVSEGGHYLVDVLAGSAVAVFAYWAAGKTLPGADVTPRWASMSASREMRRNG